MVQPILYSKKILVKGQNCLFHIVFMKTFGKKTIQLNPYSPFMDILIKNNVVQSIKPVKENFLKRQYNSTHIVFLEI